MGGGGLAEKETWMTSVAGAGAHATSCDGNTADFSTRRYRTTCGSGKMIDHADLFRNLFRKDRRSALTDPRAC